MSPEIPVVLHSEAGTEEGKHDPWSNSRQLNVYREALYEVWSSALICNCGKWVPGPWEGQWRDGGGTVEGQWPVLIC